MANSYISSMTQLRYGRPVEGEFTSKRIIVIPPDCITCNREIISERCRTICGGRKRSRLTEK